MHTRTVNLLLTILLLQCPIVLAQEDVLSDKLDSNRDHSPLSEMKEGTSQGQLSKMSAVKNEDTNLSTSIGLVKQTSNTAMVAGSCVVIDMFVRQFCNANPDDISCQFQ